MEEIDSAVLDSHEHRGLLDIVDKLCSDGVSRYIDLPQIIVCGDQSSDKSSVLEAISGMSFPARHYLCTGFVTEIILRRSASSVVSFSIAPGDDRTPEEKEKFRAFTPTGSLRKLDLGSVVEEARLLMGIGDERAFTSDVLRVEEINGPQRPHLTLVDLPGLFHARRRDQSAEDRDLVKSLVLSYIQRERTIILAVIAESDFDRQEVLQLAREIDPQRLRTLGLITKPDTLGMGSDTGWHVLRNRDFDTHDFTLEERNWAETQFFFQGVWTSMSPSHLGAARLKKRLNSVLHDQVLSQLPEVVKDFEENIRECKGQLQKTGPSKATTEEQQQYLLRASHQFYKLMKSATDGNYDDPFFGSPDEGYEKRLRAVVQNSLLDMATVMELKGRSRKVVETGAGPGEVSRDDFLHEVKRLITMNRGSELPGTYSPAIIGQLFRNQSKPWRHLLDERATSIIGNASGAVQAILEHILGDAVTEDVFKWTLNASLGEMELAMKRKLDEIMTPHESLHPITYNSSLVEATYDNGVISETLLSRGLLRKAKQELDRDASSDAADWMETYCDISHTRTLDDFSVLAVESCLVQKLPGLFSPEVVYLLDDETIRRIASADEVSAKERVRLTDTLAILEAGLGELRSRTGYQAGFHGRQSNPNGIHSMPVESTPEVSDVECSSPLPSPPDAEFPVVEEVEPASHQKGKEEEEEEGLHLG